MTEELTKLFSGNRPISLKDSSIASSLCVVVLAPHPDDFDAIGVSMRLLKENGNRIEVAVVTSGASGVKDGYGGAFTVEAKGALREQEQIMSFRFFGLPDDQLIFLRLAEDANGDPIDNTANLELVRGYLISRRPDLVFMPHWNDTNKGHQQTYAFFRKVVESERLSLVACLIEDPKTIGLRRDLYMVFDGEMETWKRKLLTYHQSQHERNMRTRGHGFDDRILNVNRKSAEALGKAGEYTEVFEIERHVRGG